MRAAGRRLDRAQPVPAPVVEERGGRSKWSRLVLAIAALAILVEQYPIGMPSGDLTDHVPLFLSLSDSLHMSGVYVNPLELLFALVLVALFLGPRRARLPRTYLALGLAALATVVTLAAVHGLLNHGDYKMVFWEIRPTLYVALMYVFTAQLGARVETITAVLWLFVIGVAFKAAQGLFLMPAFFSAQPRPEYLLSHEDSFFFVLYIVLVIALWLFHQKGRLRTIATLLLPLIVVVNLANNRRTSWAMLGATLAVLIVLVWIRVPDRRRLIAAMLAALAFISTVYLPLYWNRTGLLAGPAEAIRSQITPDLRQQLSDLYRQQENANLVFNIHMSPVIGVGYGVRIDYALHILVDLTRGDPFLNFIPHNDLLYIWLRLGAIGALVFWSFIGFAFLSACRVVRAPDPRLALYGTFTVCALIAYLILGNLDLGFFWFRVAITMGVLLGTLEVARRVQLEQEAALRANPPEPEQAWPRRRRAQRRAPARQPALHG